MQENMVRICDYEKRSHLIPRAPTESATIIILPTAIPRQKEQRTA
jgi:hypothetical protein